MKPEDWDKFLIKMADTYQVKGKPRKVFLERFDYENWGKSDTEIKNISQVPSIETYKKHANTIYKQFSKDQPNGCPKLDSSDAGAGKFEILRTWLQEAMYPQWLAEQQPEVSSPSLADIDWRDVCGKVLAQQRENQRLRRQATERGFELNVYVPLGLVERKQQQRRRGDVPLEEVYQLTEEVITKEYDNDKFLTEVIEPGRSRRIAIIGEPGAGKTTLQEKIAVWIHDNNKGLPICIPLGGLQGKSLEDYLLQIWLKAALRFIEPEASRIEVRHIASLKQQFLEGKVWLLLDGVDEMAATSPVEALATIKEQLTDWLVEARVVLTCRLNVWDAKVNNTLTGFETYRTLEFKPEQVEKFIRDWFACANESQRGEELLRKLQETGRERIRQLVRNPLRLSLLCQTSYVLPVDEPLPETKAALYERFTRYFYEWKQEQHPTTRTERRQLNQALGELAKAGIDSTTRFRLGEDLACDVMGEALFDLACRLGWLNLVDREAKTDEAVYAFFHPTFQEYFAACAIDDWRYFLNHDNENPNPIINPNPSLEYDGGKPAYRIFEPKWKEVILLWLGRNEGVEKKQKEEFLQALVKFKDGCMELFYRYQAYLLAAAGIAEFNDFSDCNTRNHIVNEIIKWSFGKTYQVEFPYPHTQESKSHKIVENSARAILSETDRKLVITKLSNILNDEERSEETIFEVASLLLKLSPGNCKALSEMKYLIQKSQNHEICKWASLKFIESTPDESDPIFDRAYKMLLESIGGAITREAWESNWKKWTQWYSNRPNCGDDALSRLLSIAREVYNNRNKQENQTRKIILSDIPLKATTIQDQVQELIEILETGINPESNLMYIHHLIYIGHRNQDALQKLIEIVENPKNKDFYYAAIEGLGIICIGSLEAFNCLLKVINTGRVPLVAIWSMKNILDGNLFDLAVRKLKHQFLLCDQIIWHCAQNMPYPDFYQAWQHPTIQ